MKRKVGLTRAMEMGLTKRPALVLGKSSPLLTRLMASTAWLKRSVRNARKWSGGAMKEETREKAKQRDGELPQSESLFK